MPSADQRRYSPAAERNSQPIYEVLQTVLPDAGTVLEIASGTGQHAIFLAPRLASLQWLPSDPSAAARQSIQSWIAATPAATLHQPLNLDVTESTWPHQVLDWQNRHATAGSEITAIVNINMIHISPWMACEGLISGAAQLLSTGQILYLYGPFRQDGKHTAPSNAAFDRSLRSQNPAWGVRDLEAVVDLAKRHELDLATTVAMPANNLSVVFHKGPA